VMIVKKIKFRSAKYTLNHCGKRISGMESNGSFEWTQVGRLLHCASILIHQLPHIPA
jgi:hypothetical protein